MGADRQVRAERDFQRKFMQSLARHFEINRAYFDLLWEQMQANSLAMA